MTGFDGVDWRRAPKTARWWAIDADGQAHWFNEPNVAEFSDFWYSDRIRAPDFGYCGNYKASLTERPSRAWAQGKNAPIKKAHSKL